MASFPMTFADHAVGEKVSLVSKLCCFDPCHEAHIMEALYDKVTFKLHGLLDGSHERFSLMNVRYQQQYPTPILALEHDSHVFQHGPPTWTSLRDTIDLCSGFGGFCQGSTACGFYTRVAVDFNDKMVNLFSKQCNSETIVGDVCSLSTIAKIWDVAKGSGTLTRNFPIS